MSLPELSDQHFLNKEIKMTEMEEFEEFEKKLEEVENLIQGLVAGNVNPEDVPETVCTKKKPKSVNVTRRDSEAKTCDYPNQMTLSNLTAETMSPEVFMRVVEEDANSRHRERMEKNQRSDELNKKANAAFRDGNKEKALSLYNQALDIRRDSSLLYCNRAVTLLGLGLYTKACQDCESAIKLHDSLKPRLLKSRALFEMGATEESEVSIQEAKLRFPDQKQQITEYVAEWKHKD